MITKNNFKQLLTHLGFAEHKNIFTKKIHSYELKVDFKNENLIYPDGLTAHRDTTKNFSQPENFVVFECVYSLLEAGYKPEHIVLEQGMPGGHGLTGGFCDIIVQDNDKKPYLLIECKTADDGKSKEFSKAWNKMLKDGGQLFNYYNSYRQAKWICLYSSDFDEETEKNNKLYHLISMQDNEEYLKTNASFKSFKEVSSSNSGKEEYFKVWKNTYQYDFISHNLFESEVFKIGNRPFGTSDLKIVDNTTIQKKYHQFATIMRQHNVSGRENAFDKLVNIFLCKIVDENSNPDNLKVYWKGAASDNHYDFQDRLQSLYKVGMQEFLNEDVTYIEQSQIENAFKFFKNKKDETKKTILEYFKQLKFYSNNAFAFLDVHNENLFLQNAVILKEVVQMLQDIKLKNEDEQHQFLGDLFEGFLDQGIKQSEGQFFTPMPIVKFLISSLPLEEILKNEAIPKVIDYACGAGHFLTEYASQMKEIIPKEKLKSYYENIYGIEKEYRLSKVAKVSAFMYGQDQINIIYADALAKNSRIKNNDFNVLVANPPYSVKGFLATLSDEDKQAFDLYDNLSEDSFNSIETFFIERAKQLLKPDGVAAIVLPSSILTNGNIYIKCREIILKYFDLVAIAEFGSGTFGKTGTNTATLFLRRKEQKPDIAEHYKNRVEEWFKGDFNTHMEQIFADEHLLQNYCTHCGLDFSEYKKFLQGQENTIFDSEIFADYKKEFDNSTEIKGKNGLKSKQYFKKSSKQEQEDLLNEKFREKVLQKEKEKVYFYLLAQDNTTEVLIVKSPEDKKARKTFLGYEWSSAKGNEGIKYLGGTERKENEDDTLEVLKGIYGIQTPLFNPNHLGDENKINTYIRKHFMGEHFTISEENKAFVSLLSLVDMLDFSRTSFDKALRTSIQKKIEVKSKYPLVKLGDLCSDIVEGKTPAKTNGEYWNSNDIYWFTTPDFSEHSINIYKSTQFVSQKALDEGKVKLIPINSVLLSCTATLGKIGINRVPLTTNQQIKSLLFKEIIKPEFFVYYFNGTKVDLSILANNSGVKHINLTMLSDIKIPLPPLDIQQQIVTECEKIDEEYENSRMSIDKYREKIAQIFHDLQVLEKTEWGGVKRLKINELCCVLRGVTYSKNEQVLEKTSNIILTSDNITELGEFKITKKIYLSENKIIDKEKQLRKNDLFVCFSSGSKTHIGKLTFISEDTLYYAGGFMGILRPKKQDYFPKYLYLLLNSETYRDKVRNLSNGANINNLSNSIGDLKVSIPSLAKQQEIVTEIESYEAEIEKLEKIMQQSANKKKAILEKYL